MDISRATKTVKAAAYFLDVVPSLRNKIPSLNPDHVREIFPNRWMVNGSPFEKAFGFRCQIGLEESLADALAWYRRVGTIDGNSTRQV